MYTHKVKIHPESIAKSPSLLLIEIVLLELQVKDLLVSNKKKNLSTPPVASLHKTFYFVSSLFC